MPYAFQAMSARTDYKRGLLAAPGAVLQARQIVGKYLDTVQQIIEVLYLGDRFQSAKGCTDALSDDGTFTYAGVRNSQLSKLTL
jgi:hypothetical protein